MDDLPLLNWDDFQDNFSLLERELQRYADVAQKKVSESAAVWAQQTAELAESAAVGGAVLADAAQKAPTFCAIVVVASRTRVFTGVHQLRTRLTWSGAQESLHEHLRMVCAT